MPTIEERVATLESQVAAVIAQGQQLKQRVDNIVDQLLDARDKVRDILTRRQVECWRTRPLDPEDPNSRTVKCGEELAPGVEWLCHRHDRDPSTTGPA